MSPSASSPLLLYQEYCFLRFAVCQEGENPGINTDQVKLTPSSGRIARIHSLLSALVCQQLGLTVLRRGATRNDLQYFTLFYM